jgi:hypothetical protein
MFAAYFVYAALLLFMACGEASSPLQKTPLSRATPVEPDPEAERAPSWATEAGKSLERGLMPGGGPRIAPATVTDRSFATDEPVPVRRLVYRVSIVVPDTLHAPHPPLLPSPAELHLDVGLDRLRARFQGSAWPVDEGSEIRLRADVPGVYVFDGAGGRPLAPGHLGSWFAGDEGQPIPRRHAEIRRDPGPLLEGPAELVCALIAEWTSQSRDALEPHCAGGAIPLAFRFGMWSLDVTAIVPMTMQRVQLRADTADAPRSLASTRIRTLLSARDIARLPPLSARTPGLPVLDVGLPDRGALRVRNDARTRMLVVVQGVPLAWLQPAAATEFEGFTSGYYRVAALRANVDQVATPAPMLIPGELEVGYGRDEVQLESPRPSTSPDAAR